MGAFSREDRPQLGQLGSDVISDPSHQVGVGSNPAYIEDMWSNNLSFTGGTILALCMLLASLVVEAKASSPSVSRTALKQRSNWSAQLSTYVLKNQDQFSKFQSNSAVAISYQFSRNLIASYNMAFARPFSEYTDENKYGFQDVSLGLSIPRLHRSKGFKVSSFMGLSLPTSKTSSEASMHARTELGLSLSWRLATGDIYSSHALNTAAYEFDTADDSGTHYNSPAGMSNSLGFRTLIYKTVLFSVSGSLHTLYTLNDATENVQRLSASLGARLTKNLSLALVGHWKDKVVSNDDRFDDDNTYAGFGMEYIYD